MNRPWRTTQLSQDAETVGVYGLVLASPKCCRGASKMHPAASNCKRAGAGRPPQDESGTAVQGEISADFVLALATEVVVIC